jgi:hypothetical protein
LCCELLGLPRLDLAIDHRERLPGADPLARLDQDRRYHPALAGDPDRHVHAGRDRPGCGDHSSDLRAAWNDHGHGRNLPATRPGTWSAGCRLIPATAEDKEGGHKQPDPDDRRDDDIPPAPRAIDHDQRVGAREGGFPVHRPHSFRHS